MHVKQQPVLHTIMGCNTCPCHVQQKSTAVVWRNVAWRGVVWCGVVWCGVVWCGVVWCGVVWCGVVCAVVLHALQQDSV